MRARRVRAHRVIQADRALRGVGQDARLLKSERAAPIAMSTAYPLTSQDTENAINAIDSGIKMGLSVKPLANAHRMQARMTNPLRTYTLLRQPLISRRPVLDSGNNQSAKNANAKKRTAAAP